MGKKIGIAIAAIVLLGVAVAFYAWRQLTALPEWYAEDGGNEVQVPEDADPQVDQPLAWVPVDEPPAEPPPPDAPEASETPPKRPRSAKRSKRSKRYEMRGFHRAAKTDAPQVVKASRALLDDEGPTPKLEAGVILDLSQVPTDKLSASDRELHRKALAAFPALSKRDVYVGIEDEPVTKDGILQLGKDTTVRIGNVRYGLDDAARKIGMSPDDLRRELNRELRRMKIENPTP